MREDVVRDAGDDRDLLRPAGGRDVAGDERRKQRVHLPRLVVQLDLPQQLHVLDVVLVQDRFVALPCGALRIAAVGQPVGLFLPARMA